MIAESPSSRSFSTTSRGTVWGSMVPVSIASRNWTAQARRVSQQALGGGSHVVGHAGIGLEHLGRDRRVVVAGERVQGGRLKGVVGRLAGEPEHDRDSTPAGRTSPRIWRNWSCLARSALSSASTRRASDSASGLPRRRPSVTDCPLYLGQRLGQLGRQPGKRPAGVGRLEARPSGA